MCVFNIIINYLFKMNRFYSNVYIHIYIDVVIILGKHGVLILLCTVDWVNFVGALHLLYNYSLNV